MKFAASFSGQPRVELSLVQNHEFSLPSDRFDKYIHSWWHSSHQGKSVGFFYLNRYPSLDMGQRFVESYRPADFLIEDFKNFDITFCKSHNYKIWSNVPQVHYDIFTPDILYAIQSQTYSVMKCVEIASKSKKYDAILRVRPDTVFTKDVVSILERIDMKDDEIYVQSSMEGGHIYCGEFSNRPCDWFFCGNPAAMTKFCNEWHNSIRETYANGIIHSNDSFSLVSSRSGVKIVLVNFGVIVQRQLVEGLQTVPSKKYYEDFDCENLKVARNLNDWPVWTPHIDFHFLRRQGL